MTKTKLKNVSGSVVTLKEGTAGILRPLCDLKHGEHYSVFYEVYQTYKEYWCIGEGSDQFTLSSDDLIGWKEIEIKAIPASDPKKFKWEGTIPFRASAAPGASAASSTPPPHSSFLSKLVSKAIGLFSGQKPPGTVITTTITTDPATTTTTVTTDPATASNTATVPAPTDAATPAATTTVTITSTTLATTAPSTTTP